MYTFTVETLPNGCRFIREHNIKLIHVNEAKRTICVVFGTGAKQIVRCHPEDHFNVEIGVSLAIARNLCGSRSALKKEIESHRKDVPNEQTAAK